MVEFVTRKITDTLIKNHAAEESQRMVVIFGIEAIINKIIHFSAMLIIGLLFGQMFEIIIFHLFYQKLRTYAGGHHAKSNIICFLCSCGIAVSVLTFWSLCLAEYQMWCTLVFFVISFPAIWFLSPVSAVNKPLDEAETVVYRKKARTYLIIEAATIIFFIILGYDGIALVGATALAVLTIMLGLGGYKRKAKKEDTFGKV